MNSSIVAASGYVACVFVVAQLLRARLAKDLAIGDHEPLTRKLKGFGVVVAASSPRALVVPPTWLSGGFGLLLVPTRDLACWRDFGRLT